MNFNIIDLNSMMYHIDEEIESNKKLSIIGGMSGTNVLRYVLNAALQHYVINDIMIVQGCQDFANQSKEQPLLNIFYGDLFIDTIGDTIEDVSPLITRIQSLKIPYNRCIDTSLLKNYQLMVITEGHLLSKEIINAIRESFAGKIIMTVDPFDIGGDIYAHLPCIVESVSKVSQIVGYARHLYGVQTRFFSKTIKCSIDDTKKKFNKRSLGKIDNRQYITNDEDIAKLIREKQLNAPFRKNQHVIVTDNRFNRIKQNDSYVSLPKNALGIIDRANNSLVNLKLNSSPLRYKAEISYNMFDPDYMIKVKPANILNVQEASHHRYNNTVVALSHPLTKTESYSLLKNANNIIFGHV